MMAQQHRRHGSGKDKGQEANDFSLRYLSTTQGLGTSTKKNTVAATTPMSASSRSRTADGSGDDGGLAEMAEIQEQNRHILKTYISMHPVTLRFNNPDIESDYQVFFEAKRCSIIRTSFALVGGLALAIAVLLDLSVVGFALALTALGISSFCILARTAQAASRRVSARIAAERDCEAAEATHRATAKPGLGFIFNAAIAIRRVLPNDDVILSLCVLLAAAADVFGSTSGGVCSTGFGFALIAIATVTARMTYWIAFGLQGLVFAVVFAGAKTVDPVDLLSSAAILTAFTYSLRLSEFASRRDFRLTRRLAAENIDVRVETTTRNWFEFGQSKVSPTADGSPGRKKATITPNFIIRESDLQLGEVLGSGSFGQVRAGTWCGTDVAIKKVHGSLKQEVIIDFGVEAGIMASLRHPNIVMYMGTCLSPLMMVMELMPRGSLHKVLHVTKTKLDWSLRLRILMDTARGLNFLHMLEQPILHNDLKSLNLLLDNDWRCKVCDFGFSKIRSAALAPATRTVQAVGGELPLPRGVSANAVLGAVPADGEAGPGAGPSGPQPTERLGAATIGWAAPECIRGEESTTKSDVFSYGVIIFELLALALPFNALSKDAIPLMTATGKRPSDFVDLESIIASISGGPKRDAVHKLRELMTKCWSSHPDERPAFGMVLESLDQIIKLYFGPDVTDWQEKAVYPTINKSPTPEEALPASADDDAAFAIKPEDLTIGPRIGAGAYGEVFEAVYHGTHVAVKQFFISGLPAEVLREFNKECRLMLNMRHPNVVLFMGSWTKPPKLMIVTELLARGSLYYTYTNREKPATDLEHHRIVLRISEGMALGLNYLHNHSPPIVHRDMKSPNVLLDENWNAKIADFGLSRIKEEGKVMTSVGSPLWAAPEVLRGEESGFPSDVYSFAVVIWEAFEWAEPYPGMSPSAILRQVAFSNLRPKLGKATPAPFQKLLTKCWADDPKKRPNFNEIITTLAELSDLMFGDQAQQDP